MRLALWIGALALAPALFAADVSGIWVGQMATRNGEFQDVAFKFTQHGANLGGKMYGDYQSQTISQGTIAEDLVTFIVNAPEQNGNQINDTRIRFTGKIVNGEMELTREREGSTSAGSGAVVQLKNSTKQAIRLKRLPSSTN
jgi:hypothetical protein